MQQELPSLQDKPVQARFTSLDVFRGMTVALMILVNNPGSWNHIYPPLEHAKWDGCTPTDLVFPFFLFAVGNAMSFALSKYPNTTDATKKILTRTLLIFLIGIFLNWFPFVRWDGDDLVAKTFEKLRFFGVLPRIALAYCGAAFLAYFIKRLNVLLIISCIILLAYWAILLTFGDLTLEGNAVRRLDIFLFGENHLYRGYESEILKKNIPFDPEGLLSTLPAIVSVLIGFFIGKFIQEKGKTTKLLASLLIAGSLLTVAGLVLNFVFPINKPIWSSSYVLFTSGLAVLLLTLLIYIIEFQSWSGWAYFFLVFGRNPLFIFVLSGVVVKLYLLFRWKEGDKYINVYSWLYDAVFKPLAGDLNGSLLFAVFHVILFWAIGVILDKKKIYIRV
jgi:predicted acyltransferase